MKKNILTLSLLMLLLVSCGLTSLRYIHYSPKKVAFKESKSFENSISDYGALYIKTYDAIDYEQKNNLKFKTIYTVHRRLKILNKAGYDYARLFIPKSDMLKNFHAEIIRTDSSVTVLNRKDLTEVTSPASLPVIDKERYYIYSVPGVEDGIIIDYSYTMETSSISYFEKTFITTDLPVLDAQYDLAMISYWKHDVKAYNQLKFPKITDVNPNKTLYSWEFKELLPQKYEVYSDPQKRVTPYYISSIRKIKTSEMEYPIVEDWEDLKSYIFQDSKNTAWFSNYFKDELKIIRENKEYGKTDAETIYNYVLDKFELKFGSNKDLHDPEKVVKSKVGSMYGLTKMTYILLKEAGHNPSYLLLKPYAYGELDYENPSPYQYLIAVPMVDSKPMFLLSKGYPYGVLPDVYDGTYGVRYSFKESKKKSKRSQSLRNVEIDKFFIDKSPMKNNTLKIDIDLKLDNAVLPSIQIKETRKEHQAYWRKNYYQELEKSEKKKEKLDEAIQQSVNRYWQNTIVKNYSLENVNETYANLVINYDFENSKVFERLGDEILVHIDEVFPNIYSRLEEIKDRHQSFYMQHANIDTITLSIEVPKGFEPDYVYEPIDPIDNEYLVQNISLVKANNTINIHYIGGVKNLSVPVTEAGNMSLFAKNIAKLRSLNILLKPKAIAAKN